eukprot:XP_800658.3 PREDICTED: protein PRRC2A isoform X2 [Strongylocentrotus purpuratus]
MSDRSAVTNKGKDGKSKYSSLNLYDTYKGKSVEPQKLAVSHGRGLQSLGKVGNARRVPPNLPSLRSEHQGNDPNINLISGSGSGWGSDEKNSENAPESQAADTQPPQQQQQQQQAPPPPRGPSVQEDSQSGKSWHPPAPNALPKGAPNQVGAPPPMRIAPPPSRLDQEFPSLGTPGDQPAAASSSSSKDSDKEKENPKEVQYGPGPSLRPQNVKSWREGGSSLNKSGGTGTGEAEGLASSSPGAALDKDRPMMPPHGMPPPGIMNGAQGNAPPPGPMQQFRGMMPQYMQFGPRGMPTGPGGPRGPPPPMNPYNMGYPGGPGMQGPPPRHGYPPQHQNAMMQQPGPNRGPPRHQGRPEKPGSNKEGAPRPAIVNMQHLTDMDELAASKTEEGWAVVSGEVDYSEKLVFSDEEDDSPKKRAERGAAPSGRDGSKDRKDGRPEEDSNQRSQVGRDGVPHGPPRANWEPNDREGSGPPPPRGPHHGRMPPANVDQAGHSRQSVDDDDDRWKHQKQIKSSEMSSNIERARQRREEEQKKEEEIRKAASEEKLRQLDERIARDQKLKEGDTPAAAPPAEPTVPAAPPAVPREIPKRDSAAELPKGEKPAEREMDSNRDREWERDRERHYERDHERGEVPYSREGMVIKRQRTESGSSDGSRQGRDRRDGGNYNRQPTRNIPPRFLKQQQAQQEQQHGHQQRRQPPFPQQDQQWHGRDGGRGNWVGGSGPTTPTTPPFGQEPRQFPPGSK